MARIVAVHGIGQQLQGSHTLHQEWLPALCDGLERVGVALPDSNDLVCAFYGDLFRRKGTRTLMEPPYDATDVEEVFESDLLELWWREAARVEPQVAGPDFKGRSRTPQVVQRALNALSYSRFFTGITERLLIGDLKQVRSYLSDATLRTKIQERVVQEVSDETRVLIGHSLGSVVAYEALCAHPEWAVRAFVTLGSPLGIQNLIFDRLQPPPIEGLGMWPGSVLQWMNIADGGDIVALEKELSLRFGDRVQDKLIYNGATAHDVRPYFTAEETGRAIYSGLVE